ncbi:unnamed protein product, partial [Rotaria sp. Silwood1]
THKVDIDPAPDGDNYSLAAYLSRRAAYYYANGNGRRAAYYYANGNGDARAARRHYSRLALAARYYRRDVYRAYDYYDYLATADALADDLALDNYDRH